MANIQQSVNSVLSSAQAGAFLFGQTPFYRNTTDINTLKARGKQFNKTQTAYEAKGEELLKKKPGEGASAEEIQEWENQYETWNKEYGKLGEQAEKLATELLQKTGNPRYFRPAEVSSQIQEQTAAEIANLKKQQELRNTSKQANASKKAQEAYAQRTFTLQDQMDTLAANKEYLSAKQRGQLSTIGHTLAKKGVIEYGE